MTRTRWKKRLGRSKYSDAKTLVLLIAVSFAAHIAFILFFPGFTIFSSPPEYIEIDMIDIGRAFSAGNGDENMADDDIQPPRVPEETAPVIETGLSALEWEAFAPQPVSDLREFDWQTRAKSEPVASETMPRAENLFTQVMPDKELPDIAEREAEGVSLVDDAVTAVAQPPRQADEQASETPAEFALSAPSEAASFDVREPLPPVGAIRQSSRTLPVERLDAERETWARPELEKENILPVRLPEPKSVPEFEQRETFQVDVPSVASASSSESDRITPQEEMPTFENFALPAPSTALTEPILTARTEQETLPTLPERERLTDRVAQPTVQAEPLTEKAIPVEQAPEVLPIPTVARHIQETPVADNAYELLPPQPLTIRPRISEDDERITSVRETPTARRSWPAVQENRRLPAQVEPVNRERTVPATTSVPERALTKAQPQESDETEKVIREETPPEETVQIEGPASARQVRYRPPSLPSVTLDRDVTIRLKFWVLPDGAVGEVVPLQRGDVRLEQAAIQYVKSWRFTPIAGSEMVWGIIPVKYRLK